MSFSSCQHVPLVALTVALTSIGITTPAEGGEPWTLERAVRYALEHSPDARLAEQRLLAAQSGVQQANAAFMPQLQIQSSYIWTNNPVTVFGSSINQQNFGKSLNMNNFNDVPNMDNLDIRGTISMPIYAGGGNLAGKRVARATTRAAMQQAAAVRAGLAFEVARAFYTVLKTREFVRATEAAVRAFESNLAIASKRASAGTLLRADVLDVEVRLAQAREDLVRARNARELASRALRMVLGIEHGKVLVADELPPLRKPPESLTGRRAELAAQQQQIEAAEAGVRRAKAGYQPRVNAFATMAFDQGFRDNGNNLSYVAGVNLEWNAFDGLLTRARAAQARAELQSAHEASRKLRLAIALEVEQARLRLEEATERLSVTTTAIAQAEESAELTRARFKQGLALATQLIAAETALTAARVRRADAATDQRIAVAALRHAVGLPQVQ